MSGLKVQTTMGKKNWMRKVYVIFYAPWCYAIIQKNVSILDRNLDLEDILVKLGLDNSQNMTTQVREWTM